MIDTVLRSNFTETQQRDFHNFPSNLKQVLSWKFLASSRSSTIKVAGVVLDVLSQHKVNFEEESFFCELLNSPLEELIPIFEKIRTIAQQGLLSSLVKFASTKKQQRVDHTSLSKITQFFYHSAEKLDLKPHLSALLPYEEGGSAQLKKLQEALPSTNNSDSGLSIPIKFSHESLNSTEIEWLKFILCRFGVHPKQSGVDSFVSKLVTMKTEFGEEWLLLFCQQIKKEKTILFQKLLRLSNLIIDLNGSDDNNLWTTFDLFVSARLTFEEFLNSLEALETKITQAKKQQESFESLLERFKKDPMVSHPLSDEALSTITKDYYHVQSLIDHYKTWTMYQLIEKVQEIRHATQKPSKDQTLTFIAIGTVAFKHQFHIHLHPTQIIAVLGLLITGTSRIAQVKTGEGKSYIVALLAFILSLQNRAVDIISSARALAIRDQAKFASFFKKFDIVASSICVENPKAPHFLGHILYGTVADFEWAWMREKLYGQSLFSSRLHYVSRSFDCAIVDEVDNLLIDTASNSARIAYPDRNPYQWVYAPILSFVYSNGDKISTVKELRNYLLKHVDSQFKLLIPQLKDERLSSWLTAAKVSLKKKELVDYVVNFQKKSSTNEITSFIKIVDAKNTGSIQENTRWSSGIHEFIETKHDIPVQQESFTPLSLSHAVFYQFYQTIYGLSGTIGSLQERKEIQNIYNIDSFDVPPHLPSKRVDYPSRVSYSGESYFKLILERVQTMYDTGRPILILCKTIEDSKAMHKVLAHKKIPAQLWNELQSENGENIVFRAGFPKTVTIATNNAGRGTDIPLQEESLKKGGLHVLVTFYPESRRVEEQAIGRAGRQGQPGSSEIIVKRDEALESIKNPLLLFLSQDPLQSLDTERQLFILQRSEEHLCRAQIERFSFPLIEKFLKAFSNWKAEVASEDFLTYHSQRLYSLKLVKEPAVDLTPLTPEEKLIAEECIYLLSRKRTKESDGVELLKWKVFLKRAAKTLEDQIILKWCVYLCEPMEKIVLQGQQDVANLKKTTHSIQKLFEETRLQWERYFSSDGIFIWIHEMAQITLLNRAHHIDE